MMASLLRKTIFPLLAFLCFCMGAMAQEELEPEDTRVVYNRANAFGLSLNSSGYGIQFRRTQITGEYKKRYYEADFMRLKHPKEIQVVNQFVDNSRSYVFGMENVFNTLRLGTGTDKLVFDKANENGVEIHLIYGGGLSLGFVKPVYVDIQRQISAERYIIETVRYTKDVSQTSIIGKASYWTGFNEAKIHPGIYAKTGLNFDFSKNDERIKAIETGLVADIFYKKVPQFLVYNKSNVNKGYYISFYANFMFGKKK